MKLFKIEIKEKNINDLKILLANKATAMLHGEKESKNSEKTAKEVFSDNSLGLNLPSIVINKKSLIAIKNLVFRKYCCEDLLL